MFKDTDEIPKTVFRPSPIQYCSKSNSPEPQRWQLPGLCSGVDPQQLNLMLQSIQDANRVAERTVVAKPEDENVDHFYDDMEYED